MVAKKRKRRTLDQLIKQNRRKRKRLQRERALRDTKVKIQPLVINKQNVDKYLEDSLASAGYPLSEYERAYQQTLCEVVSETEVYVLRENPDYNPHDEKSKAYIRGKRICGRLRVKNGLKLRCLLPAGYNTDHVGWGSCRLHSAGHRQASGNSLKILEGYYASGLALELKELYDVAPHLLDDPKLGDVEDEIHALNLVLRHQLNRDIGNTEQLLKTTKTLAEVKKMRQQIRTEKLLFDVRSLSLFLSGLFQILRKHLGNAQFSKILAEIEAHLFMPLNKSMQLLIQSDLVMEKKSEPLSGQIEIQPHLPGSNYVRRHKNKK